MKLICIAGRGWVQAGLVLSLEAALAGPRTGRFGFGALIKGIRRLAGLFNSFDLFPFILFPCISINRFY